MTTTLRIVHNTGFTYSNMVSDSFNEIRMSPLYTPNQLIRERTVNITPRPWSTEYIDYWGTHVTAFELHEPHDQLLVRVSTTLDVEASDSVESDMTVAEVAEYSDRWNEFLELSRTVDPGDDLAGRADVIAAESTTIDEIALRICKLIHEDMTYSPGATEVSSVASDAWERRQGVCQDYSHLVVGALRYLGIPARYVSGYVMPKKDVAVGETVAGESHAWVQWFNGKWFSYDPTNDRVPGEDHVMVGQGREYNDVVPLRGMFSGGSGSEMFVSVNITKVR